MSYLKLVKLLYIAEREALIRWGHPIFYDQYVSMDKGPVVSQTYNVLNGESKNQGPWKAAISAPSGYEVSVLHDPGTGELSPVELALIDEIYRQYGHLSRWDICELTHAFKEWRDPQGSSIPISYEEILRQNGTPEDQVRVILEDLQAYAAMQEHLRQ